MDVLDEMYLPKLVDFSNGSNNLYDYTLQRMDVTSFQQDSRDDYILISGKFNDPNDINEFKPFIELRQIKDSFNTLWIYKTLSLDGDRDSIDLKFILNHSTLNKELDTAIMINGGIS
jgi:hypothetical protein